MQAEVNVNFVVPDHNATVGVVVMAEDDPTTSGMIFFVEYSAPSPPLQSKTPLTVRVGSANVSISSKYKRVMPGLTFGGADYRSTNVTDYHICQRRCDADPKCVAWNFDAGHNGKCSHKSAVTNSVQTIWNGPVPSPNVTSGVKTPSICVGARYATLQLLPHEAHLNIRIYIDNTMAEAFWQGGRVVMTREADPPPGLKPTIAVYAEDGDFSHMRPESEESGYGTVAHHNSSKPIVLQSVAVWQVEDMWVSPEEVLRGRPAQNVESLFV